MALSYRTLLEQPRCRDRIAKGLPLDDIVDDLVEIRLITEQTYMQLYSKDEGERCDFLLACICAGGEKVCKLFVHFIEQRYEDLCQGAEDEREDMDLRRALVVGGFPELPRNYIVRKSLTDEIREKTIDLKWGEKLVVHGMTGYGKSSLVAQLFNDKAIMRHFGFTVFWINLGEHQNTNNVLPVMWRLYCNLITMTDEPPLSHCPLEIVKLKDCLKRVFLHDRLKNALLILDDVISSDVIDAFDFKCRLVITTQYKDVVKQLSASFVEVKIGFSEKESLELFKQALDVEQLCDKAKIIHELGKGFPLFMALMSSFLSTCREEAISMNRTQIWDDLIEKLRNKPFLTGGINDYTETDRAIAMCLDKLDTEMRDYYFDLVVFDEDVNIMPNVLETFWNLSSMDVRRIMMEFANKSLIVPYYNETFGAYVYGVHDLHLSYLKRKCANIKERHQKLISQYELITNGDFSKLPNDNYILSYIGYHLKNANHKKFSIYFDLKFIEAKTKAAGYKDVIRDMELYKEFISGDDPILIQKLDDFIQFIEKFGSDLFNYPNIDIVQFALKENPNNFVHKMALQIAENNPQQLYFKFCLPNEKTKNSTIKLDEDVTTACFTENNVCVLVGTSKGQILKYMDTERVDYFYGHKSEITSLNLSPDKKSFLSISKDRTAKWWKFRSTSCRNSSEFTNGIPSPKFKQTFWSNLHMAEEKTVASATFEMCEKDDFVISATFDVDDFFISRQIATGSNRGKIVIWDVDSGKEVASTTARGTPAKSVLFLNNFIVFTCGDDVFVYQRDLQFYGKFNHLYSINFLLYVYQSREIVAVADQKIFTLNFYMEKVEHHVNKTNILHAIISNDGKYLVFGDANHCVYVYNLELKKIINTIQNLGRPLDLCYINKSLVILVIGVNNKTLMQYQIMQQNLNMTHLTSYWASQKPRYAYVTTSNSINLEMGQIFSTTNTIESEIKSLIFSICGNKLIYGLNNGKIVQFNYKSKKEEILKILDGPVTYLNCFDDSTLSQTESFTSSDDYTGILVAATNRSITIFGDQYSDKYLQRNLFNCPIKLSFMQTNNQFVVVDVQCGLKIIDLDAMYDDSYTSLMNNSIATIADICQEDYLALTTDDHLLVVFNLCNLNMPIVHFRDKLETKATCLKFSHNGMQLAVGLDNGKVVIFDLKNDEKKCLILHESPVVSLHWSNGPESLLVSVADQLAWWSLKRPDHGFWSNKIANNRNVPYLLASVKPHGPHVKFFSASNDFKLFLVVDNESNVYLMEVL